ncbi:hypothetical protein HNQ91_000724 [Filimonas zeae]|uniref:Uncharacterized protein n=1 Tax=Filimonas zeae TaxID=1737353 RepID=A0A917MRL4_9BACT|nr:hypothetical protein [Filimonas zeae]MDR6337702.1 hypothetical protein [Filimonas zeae]GGH59852.1 hypothetical protein GCM10011379_07090 [Filimonas zeae]
MLVTDTWDNVLELLPAIFIHSFLMFWLLAFTLIYIEYKKVIGMKRPPLTRLVVSHLTVFFVGYLAIGFAFGTFAIWCLPVFESLLSGVVNLVIVMGLIRVLIVFDKKQRSYKIE